MTWEEAQAFKHVRRKCWWASYRLNLVEPGYALLERLWPHPWRWKPEQGFAPSPSDKTATDWEEWKENE